MRHRIVSVIVCGMMLVAAAGAAQAQSMRSSAAAPTAQQGFGGTVVVSDGRIIVGEPANQVTPGYVYAYERDDSGEWRRAVQLESPDAANGDQFGRVLAVEGDLLVTAATVDDATSVYVFGRDGDGWALRQRIAAPEGAEAEQFGRAVALTGDHLLIGAWAADDSTGAVYAYRRGDDGSFASAGRLAPSDSSAAAGGRFGARLAMDGDVALIGAPWTDEQTGAAYLFRASDSGWTEEATLESRAVEDGDRFGSSLLLHDGTAFVGTERVNRFVGAVYAFVQDDDEWQEAYALQPFDAVQQTRFGISVGTAGDELWVGAMGVNGFSGAIYRFQPGADGGWDAAEKLAAGDLSSSDVFGMVFDAENDLAAVAAPNSDFGLGSVYVFQRNAAGEWNAETELYTAPDGMDAVVDGEVRCTEGAAAGFECGGVDLVSFVPVADLGGSRGVNLNDVWGWTDPETGKEWALVGRMDGTSFVDVSNPERPVVVANLPKTEGSNSATWRDMKVYENHVYIVADGAGQHGVQVYDLTQLRAVDASDGPVTVEETALYTNVASVHNIVINEQTGFAYAVGSGQGGETCGGGLHMIDIRTPDEPTFAGCFADPSTGRQKTGYSHDAQCVVYEGPDQEYQGREICLGANETALSIADVTDKDSPVAISMATYPNVGYSHQGWFDEEQRYFYMNDELDETQGLVERTRTLVWDLADLDDPVLVKEHLGTQPSIDHNLYIKDELMYQSNYMSGLRILDISDRENPVEVAFFDTVPYGDNSPSFGGSWSNYPYFASGTIVVTSGSEGLFLLKKQEGRPVS
ncbi:MAG TPA: choice-of-anchor B family protein [Gemmatimonadota bacterium]|nr:choice-of-anchor B family protein [Gemmatimonadota bacterium]